MSQESLAIARGIFELRPAAPTEIDPDVIERRLSDDALSRYFDPEVEWVPAQQSLLAGSTYRGYDGVRRFWSDFLSAWEEYAVEPLELAEAGEQVTAVMRMKARTSDLEVDELWSSILTFRDGRVIRVQGFTGRGALEAVDPAD